MNRLHLDTCTTRFDVCGPLASEDFVEALRGRSISAAGSLCHPRIQALLGEALHPGALHCTIAPMAEPSGTPPSSIPPELSSSAPAENVAAPPHSNVREPDLNSEGAQVFPAVFSFLLVVIAACLGLLLQWRSEERQAASSGAVPRPQWMGEYVMASRNGRKHRDVNVDMRVSLEQLWRADSVAVRYERDVACVHCHGQGGMGHVPCNVCGGRGSRTVVNRAMGMIQQMACQACGGRGHTHATRCPHCGGRGSVRERVHNDLQLSPGLQGGDVVRVLGAGDQNPSSTVLPGDLVVSLTEDFSDYPHITRCSPSVAACVAHGVGHDRSTHLHAEIYVSLAESLLGFSREIGHPSGEDALVHVEAGVTQPGHTMVLRGKGLPSRSSWFEARTMHSQSGASVMELQHQGEWDAIRQEVVAARGAKDGDSSAAAVADASHPSLAKFAAASLGVSASPSLPLLWLGEIPLPRILCSVPLVSTIVGCRSAAVEHGDLLVTVNVVFPGTLSREQVAVAEGLG